jgi:hypothetical protein
MRILMLMLLAVSLSVSAETYKCEFGGKAVYSDRPCETGKGKQIAVTEASSKYTGDNLTPEQRLEMEKKKADALQKERLKKEKAEESARQKAARQAKKEDAKAEKKRKARCKYLAKRPAKYMKKHPDEREEYERECIGR